MPLGTIQAVIYASGAGKAENSLCQASADGQGPSDSHRLSTGDGSGPSHPALRKWSVTVLTDVVKEDCDRQGILLFFLLLPHLHAQH